MILILIAVLSALFIYFYGFRSMNYWKNRGVKQSNTVPFFGNSFRLVLRLQSFPGLIKETYDAFPGSRYSGTYSFQIPDLVIRDPDLIKQVTVKDFDHFLHRRVMVSPDVEPLLAKNLVALKGQEWREMRANLSPSFTSSKMKAMFHLMSEAAEKFVNYFKIQNEEIITVELKDVFTRYANDVIATCAFGIQVDSLREGNNEFYLMGKEATNFTGIWRNLKMFLLMFCPFIAKTFRLKIFSEALTSFFRNLIKNNINERETKGIVRNDMIQLLLEARKGIDKQEESDAPTDTGFATVQECDIGKAKATKKEITDDDITAQALIFFFAGFETVSTLMSFMSYELAANQDIQDKLRAEMEEIVKESNGKLTYDTLIKMKYLDMVVSECLRKWPAAVAIDRVCTKPYTIEPATPEEKPLHLKPNDVISIPIYGIHHDPEIYPNPEKFDPERFNDENKGNINPYAYLPFGSGPRNCIGNRFALLETKAVMFHILTNFKIVPVKKSVIPLVLSKATFNFTAENGFWFGFEKLVK